MSTTHRGLMAPLLALVALSLGVALSALLVESGLRVAGYEPWRDLPPLAPGEPALHEPDLRLGWRNKAGVYVWDGRKNHPSIHMTFWSGGRRATGPSPESRPRRALLLGGSFTQGWAVSDSETFGWRLQAEFSHVEFANYGTAGYGTTQSLMVFESELAQSSRAPELAIYGFLYAHHNRNVAHPAWLRGLAQRPSDAIEAGVPFAELAGGTLRLRPPLAHPDWPLKRLLAASAFFEERWFQFRSRGRMGNEPAVTRALLLEMARLAKAAGTHLLVAILDSGGGTGLVGRLRELGIDTVDCTHPRHGDRDLMVPVYGHPNARLNAYWARCIGGYLRKSGLLPSDPLADILSGT